MNSRKPSFGQRVSKAVCRLALGGIVGLACATAGAQEVRLKLHTYSPMGVPPIQHVIKPWAEELAEKSGGRIKVDIYPMMQLGGRQGQLIEQVKDGVVELVWTILGATPGRFARTEVFELPFVHRNTLASNLALREMLPKELAADFTDFKPLNLHVHAGNALHMRKNSIESLADFKNRKIRSPGQTSTEFLSAVEASPIATTLTDVSSMMSRGVLDGAMLPFDVLPAIKLYDMVDYHIVMDGDRRPTTAVFMLAMNTKSYEALPADLRELIDTTTGEVMSLKMAEVFDRFDRMGLELAGKHDAKVVTLSAEETSRVMQASEPVIQNWIERMNKDQVDAQALLQRSRDLGEKYAKQGQKKQ